MVILKLHRRLVLQSMSHQSIAQLLSYPKHGSPSSSMRPSFIDSRRKASRKRFTDFNFRRPADTNRRHPCVSPGAPYPRRRARCRARQASCRGRGADRMKQPPQRRLELLSQAPVRRRTNLPMSKLRVSSLRRRPRLANQARKLSPG